ncbi:response regulator [Pseudomonas sp. PDNC002]|uniref:response regulator n=1 Tax=Pseudomonas sp. PDNC002 TaxID=2811422 RepID=UPI001964F914|nr:response regulator [Pseudomonas sp. PDNC002]QRY77823.1 response regulator [Pseudomonas sp. PDNC002]
MRKVLIVDEHPVTRHALRQLLEAENFEVVAEADNGLDALDLVRSHKPHLMTLELSIPKLGGLELIKRLSERNSPVKILVVTSQDSEYYAGRCLQAGAAGFVSKHERPETFKAAIASIYHGQTYFPVHALGTVRNFVNPSNKDGELQKLSVRELTVLHLLAQGLGNTVIARQMSISNKTVSTYKLRLMQKLQANSMVELIDIARGQGLIAGNVEMQPAPGLTLDPERLQHLEMLHQMINAMPHPIHFRDQEGRLLLCNQATLDMHRASLDEVLGKTVLEGDWYPPEQAQFLQEKLLDCVREDQPWKGDYTIEPKGGRRVVHAWLTPYHDKDGKLHGVIGGSIDISSRARLMSELRDAYELLDSGQRSLSHFMLAVAREFYTPLNTADAMLGLLHKDEALSSTQHERLSVLQASMDQMQSMLNDLQELSRFEANKHVLAPERTNLRMLAESVTDQFVGQASLKGLQFIVDLQQVLQPEVWIDPVQFKRLLDNLLSNAIKFTDTGLITFRLRAIGCGDGSVIIRIRVKDTGIGISENDQAKIFEPFVQIQSAGRYRQSGTGLGLALCRRLVEQMKGEIHITSQLGEGTIVQVDLEVPQAILE